MSKTLKVVVGAFAAVVLAAGAGCSKGGQKANPEGKYALDKVAMKATLQAEIDKLPEEERAMPQMALGFIDMLEMQVELVEGGKLSMTATTTDIMGAGQGPKVQTKEGTWKRENDKVVLEMEGEKSLSCSVEGKRLTCGEGRESMAFNRV